MQYSLRTVFIALAGVLFLATSSTAKEKAISRKAPSVYSEKGELVVLDVRRLIFGISSEQRTTYFFGGKNTRYSKDGKSMSFSDLLPGDLIEVSYVQDGKRKQAQEVRVTGSALSHGYKSIYKRGY